MLNGNAANTNCVVFNLVSLERWSIIRGSLWPWSFSSWIYNYLWNQCLTHWCCEFESQSGRGVHHYVIKFASDLRKVDINELLLKVALNTIKQTNQPIIYRTCKSTRLYIQKTELTFLKNNIYLCSTRVDERNRCVRFVIW